MKNKKAWIKITEASIGVIIIAGILLFVYAKSPERVELSEYAYNLQNNILNEIASNDNLRAYVLISDENSRQALLDFIDEKIPEVFDFNITICDELDEYPGSGIVDREVFVQERVISGDIQNYGPKKIRLFIWQK